MCCVLEMKAGYHGGRKKNFIVRENVVFIGLLKA